MFKNALVSVSDKTGLVEFLKPLAENGLRILSTGGTAKTLKEAGIEVIDVSAQTQFPEVMDGRVKTLHPSIHMCLLARDNNPEDMKLLKEYGLEPIDLVVGNLYPFENALFDKKDDLVEFIDIGGPSFLRSAAKSFSRITVVCDPQDYKWIAEKNELVLDDRKNLAAKVFAHTSTYDSMISKTLGTDSMNSLTLPDQAFGGKFVQELRYGENPSQKASWVRQSGNNTGLHSAEILQGKPLSYNNLLDLEAATSTLSEFNDQLTAVAVKHNNPCGVCLNESVAQAVKGALEADPVSVFGGIVTLNRSVTKEAAQHLVGLFLECVVAPDFEEEALKVLSTKKNLRVLKWPDIMKTQSDHQVRSIRGGYLVQTNDKIASTWPDSWELVVGEEISNEARSELLFAWKVCAHLKSNAIAVTENSQTLGLGMGQVNRVDAVEQALGRMNKFHSHHKNPVLASDAFFPFPDSIEIAAREGIKWIIQPGGSIKDNEVIAKAKELGVNMVFTKQRHFLH